MSTDFWTIIDTQLAELRTAGSADDVLRILSPDRNPYGGGEAGDGFFAGSGGDGTVLDSLRTAGWAVQWFEAGYHWAAQAPNGDVVTYVEGDVYRGDQRVR